MPAHNRLAAALAATLAGGCLAVALPASRTDVGATVLGAGGPSLRVAAGVHSASFTRKPVELDVGAGYIYEIGQPVADPGPEVWSLTPAEPMPRQAQGGYVEASRAVQVQPHKRVWLGGRGEVLFVNDGVVDRVALGAAVRASWEIYTTARGAGAGSSSCSFAAGGAYGAVGAGLFFETGVRAEEGRAPTFLATAGVTIRLPSLAGFMLDLCH